MFKIEGNLQDIVDKVYNHLVKQGGTSKVNGMCSYRGCDYKMCAFGVLIPDKQYNKEMEFKSVRGLIHHKYVEFESDKHQCVCEFMQGIHDNYSLYDNDWRCYIDKQFEELVELYNLKFPKLEEINV